MFEDIKNTYWLCEVTQYLKMYNIVYVIVSGDRWVNMFGSILYW